MSLLAAWLVLAGAQVGWAQTLSSVTLAWNRSSGSGIAGYRVYDGTASRLYTNTIDAGNATNATVSGLASGTTYFFAVTAYATNGLESTFSSEVSWTAATNPPPGIALTAPTNGAGYLAPAAIGLAAGVSANGHAITKVQFYQGANLLAEAAAAPYVFTWSGVAAGSYVLTANLVYDSGSTLASAPVNVSVTNPPPSIVLTAPTNGASFMAPAAINLAAGVSANGHPITKVQFYQGASLLAEAATAPYVFIWSSVAAGSYQLTAKLVYDSGSTLASTPVSVSVTASNTLPLPWQTVDIGKVGVAGNAVVSGGLDTVTGAGSLAGTADSFRFLYQSLSGDGEIRAQIGSMHATNTSARAGVMVRETLTAGSRYAFMGMRPAGTFFWQRRSNTAGSTSTTTSGTGTVPNLWARLVRSGNTLTGYKSTNGVNWTTVTSRSITMATNIFVGFAVASGSTNTLNTATFTNAVVVP